jgi:hypothetical protein
MKINKQQISEQLKKIFFKFFPISVFFYVTLIKYFPRSSYLFIKTDNSYTDIKSIPQKGELYSKTRIRKKLLLDLKLHKVSINWNKKNVTKLILNSEGKIIGYKPCTLFYPNYFTKIQSAKLLDKSKILKKNDRIFLIIMKYN